MLAKVESHLGPWTLTGPSRYIARLALHDHSWQQQMREYLPAQSAQMSQLLGQYGLAPDGGTDLFQYVQHPAAGQLQQALAKQGVWTRHFYDPQALRFGLPPATDWPRLTQALETALAEING